jgi:hypothetical protein
MFTPKKILVKPSLFDEYIERINTVVPNNHIDRCSNLGIMLDLIEEKLHNLKEEIR